MSADARDAPVRAVFVGSEVWVLLKPKVWKVFRCSRIVWMYWYPVLTLWLPLSQFRLAEALQAVLSRGESPRLPMSFVSQGVARVVTSPPKWSMSRKPRSLRGWTPAALWAWLNT